MWVAGERWAQQGGLRPGATADLAGPPTPSAAGAASSLGPASVKGTSEATRVHCADRKTEAQRALVPHSVSLDILQRAAISPKSRMLRNVPEVLL